MLRGTIVAASGGLCHTSAEEGAHLTVGPRGCAPVLSRQKFELDGLPKRSSLHIYTWLGSPGP